MTTSTAELWLYAVPAVPFALRGILIWRFRAYMNEPLAEERAAREHRALILPLAGFSFSAALAIPAFGAATKQDVLLPTFFVVVSFLCFLGAVNAQSHKHVRWHDQVVSGVADSAMLSLMLGVLAMVALLQSPAVYFGLLFILSLFVWSIDVAMKLFSWFSYFRGREREDG